MKAEHVPLSVADSFLELSGEGPLTLMKWEYRLDVTVSSPSGSYSCSVHGLPGHATDSLRARLKVGVRSGGQVELTLSLDPGDVVTPVDDACRNPAWEPPFYRQAYWDYLYVTQKTPEGRFVITFPASSGLLHYGPDARRLTLQGEYGPLTVAGTLDLVLRHLPAAE